MEVRSKDQALAPVWGMATAYQLSNARLIPVTSTAEAVRESAEGRGLPRLLASLPGKPMAYPCSTVGFRTVRTMSPAFWWSVVTPLRKGTGYLTVRVSFFLPEQVGRCSPPQSIFSRGINLCKIESRPSKRKTWDYFFFVDFLGMRRTMIFARQ